MATTETDRMGCSTRFEPMYEAPLADVSGKVLNFDHLMPLRYRFIDCEQFVRLQRLFVIDSLETTGINYSAISYVWEGLKPETSLQQQFEKASVSPSTGELPQVEDGTFHVKGAEDADAISLEVLRQACLFSLKRGLPLLWLDRVCILQNNRDDKDWQIKRMHSIYEQCACCIILTAGLRMLATLENPADGDWVHRSWTFQEAVVAKKAFCLYASSLGSGCLYAKANNLVNKTPYSRYEEQGVAVPDPDYISIAVKAGFGENEVVQTMKVPRSGDGLFWESIEGWPSTIRPNIRELEKGTSVYVGLMDLLAVHAADTEWPLVIEARYYKQNPGDDKWLNVQMQHSCFAWTRSGSARALFFMLQASLRVHDEEPSNWVPFGHEPEPVEQPQIADDDVSTHERMRTVQEHCVWTSLAKRTTSRPQDAVFSVMDMLGVPLDPKDFRGLEFPRLAATVKLAQEYLRGGRRAFWLSELFARGPTGEPPGLEIRMCTMKPISEPGLTEKVQQFKSHAGVEASTPHIFDCPTGSMDDQGYLTVEVPVRMWQAGERVTAPKRPPLVWDERIMVAKVGTSIGSNDSEQSYFEEYYHYLFLSEHAPGKWDIAMSFTLDEGWDEQEDSGFEVQEVTIGGPFPVVGLDKPEAAILGQHGKVLAKDSLRDHKLLGTRKPVMPRVVAVD